MSAPLESEVDCIGPLCIDRLVFDSGAPSLDYPGGNALITASTLAASGVRCKIVGQLGDDRNGRLVSELAARHGVDVSSLRFSSDLSTKIATNRVATDGSWTKESSSPDLFPYLAEPAPESTPGAQQLFVCGLNGLLRASPDACKRSIASYRSRGATLAFGLAANRIDAAAFQALLLDDDILFATVSEFMTLEGVAKGDKAELVGALLRSRFRRCVLTWGARGAFAKWDREFFWTSADGRHLVGIAASAPLPQILDQAVDREHTPATCTVGAGDVFAGVFMAALLRGGSPEHALGSAAAAASRSTEDARWDAWLELSDLKTPLPQRRPPTAQ